MPLIFRPGRIQLVHTQALPCVMQKQFCLLWPHLHRFVIISLLLLQFVKDVNMGSDPELLLIRATGRDVDQKWIKPHDYWIAYLTGHVYSQSTTIMHTAGFVQTLHKPWLWLAFGGNLWAYSHVTYPYVFGMVTCHKLVFNVLFRKAHDS